MERARGSKGGTLYRPVLDTARISLWSSDRAFRLPASGTPSMLFRFGVIPMFGSKTIADEHSLARQRSVACGADRSAATMPPPEGRLAQLVRALP